jgi:hypothetical protein
MGSAAVAAFLAHAAFWLLLIYGWFWEEVTGRGLLVFLVLWATGLYLVPRLFGASVPFSSYVAILDVALVFQIFKGDVKLT